ncbi:hypothetical protein PGTUg99_018775 [Puccinia graminis f. sp. tritici]|uniref:Uncharacterized protein n=1 Tax=Puccinia graminis f. sp. tritici TaxID=56615 RepID=A0A5B0SJ43_PUCGR|nr:hypothetical protein PGTUg99_018775 [Puccinia graminis f. sp. tritici]
MLDLPLWNLWKSTTHALEYLPDGFTDQATKELSDQIARLRDIVAKVEHELSVHVSRPDEDPRKMKESRLGTHRGGQAGRAFFYKAYAESSEGKARRVERGDKAASDFYEGIEKALESLRNPESFEPRLEDTGYTPPNRMTLYHLNDVLVNFLVIFQRHKLVTPEWLQELLNQKNGDQIIFNYLARRFPVYKFPVAVPTVYLNVDLKLTLEESPFTEEIRGLIKYLNHSGWQRLERLHLGTQADNANFFFPGLKGYTKFIELTNPTISETVNKEELEREIGQFMLSLTNNINEFSSPTGPFHIRDISHLKLLHSMLHFMIKYHLHGSPKEQKILQDLVHACPKIQEFDETMMLFSDVLKSVYFAYGQSLKELNSVYSLHDPLRERVAKKMIFLMDMNKSNQPSIFSELRRGAVHKSEVELPGPGEDGFIGIDHRAYRLAHLFKPDHEIGHEGLFPKVDKDHQPIPTTLYQHPELPHFGPMIENILRHLKAIIQNDSPDDRLLKLEQILLHPEKFQ